MLDSQQIIIYIQCTTQQIAFFGFFNTPQVVRKRNHEVMIHGCFLSIMLHILGMVSTSDICL